jgi:hypothetical protein
MIQAPFSEGDRTMTFRILRAMNLGWGGLFAACAVASACSNNPAPVPDAFVNAMMGPGPMSPNQICNLGTQQQWLTIGTGTGNKPTTVSDGNTQSGGAAVHITCTVSASGNGFDISLSSYEEGSQGGSLTITSPSGQGAITAGSGGTVHASFQSPQYGNGWHEEDCQLTFTYNGVTVPDSPPVAAGRIWGHIDCPKVTISGQPQTLPDGGSVDRQCAGAADFLFEQCGQ